MYGMLKHILLSSLCKNNKFVSLPFLTHTTYIRFFFWPAIQAASRREKKGEEKKMRQSISSRLPLHTYICGREFPSMPVCQRGLVTSHIPSFLFLASHSQRPAIQQAVQSESRGFASQHSCHFIHANAGNSRLCLLAKESL